MSAILDLAQHFDALNNVLLAAEDYWRPSPFIEPHLPWAATHPELAARCLALTDEKVQHLESDIGALHDWLSAALPTISELRRLIALPSAAIKPVHFPLRWDLAVPGRKAAQIRAFAQCIQPSGQGFLDWCAGKSHLGRTLSYMHQQPCIALERDALLCEQGRRLDTQKRVSFIATDVLNSAVKLPENAHVLALHACGDLHRHLIREAILHGVSALSLAPCCYALWLDDYYRPLSARAQRQGLRLTRDDLKLAVQESVTASTASLTQSRQLAVWRLAFDQLQRDMRGCDQYLSTPSMPLSSVRLGFREFCCQLARKKGLVLGRSVDWCRYEAQGERRWAEVRRLQLVRHAYRRALELWLVFDAALFLEESGYRVTVAEFCERKLTPRNILIHAERVSANAEF